MSAAYIDVLQLEQKTDFALGKGAGLNLALEACLEVAKGLRRDSPEAQIIMAIAGRIRGHGMIVFAEAKALHEELREALGIPA